MIYQDFQKIHDAENYIKSEHPEFAKKQSATSVSHKMKKKDFVVITKGQSKRLLILE